MSTLLNKQSVCSITAFVGGLTLQHNAAATCPLHSYTIHFIFLGVLIYSTAA